MAWQIALQLVRQRETIEHAVASVQSVEPKNANVDFDESGQNSIPKENSELVESSSPEQLSDISKEVDKVHTNLPADQSQSPTNQSVDVEVL